MTGDLFATTSNGKHRTINATVLLNNERWKRMLIQECTMSNHQSFSCQTLLPNHQILPDERMKELLSKQFWNAEWTHGTIGFRIVHNILVMSEPNLNFRVNKSYFYATHWRRLTEILGRKSGPCLDLCFRPKNRSNGMRVTRRSPPGILSKNFEFPSSSKIPSTKYPWRGPLTLLQVKLSELLFPALIKTHNFLIAT
jgi:hypothetical protein